MGEDEFRKKQVAFLRLDFLFKFIAAIIASVGAYLAFETWLSQNIENEKNRNFQSQVELQKALAQASEKLASNDVSQRIYALEQLYSIGKISADRKQNHNALDLKQTAILLLKSQLKQQNACNESGSSPDNKFFRERLITRLVALYLPDPPNFSNMNLSCINFADITDNLSGANFKRAVVSRASFKGVNLSNSDFSRTEAISTNFESSNLNSVNFSISNIQCSNFIGTNISHTIFSNSDLRQSKFIDANGEKTIFDEADLRHSYFAPFSLNQPYMSAIRLGGAKEIQIRSIRNAIGYPIKACERERESIMSMFSGKTIPYFLEDSVNGEIFPKQECN
ncbi:MAG: pentapeptide repeat-containing protein [Candidatus Thiodiazotropha sp. 6PDIVS]